jgi:glyoxylase-like metal-dependent hydrolase (beta-lactamase superfamily II)
MRKIYRNRTRRDLLRAAGGALGASLVPLAPGRLLAATGDLARTPLGERVSLITGAGSNVVVVESDAGLALIDSGAPEQAEALVAFVESEFAGAPVRALFNTHWHPTSTGANEAFGSQGTTIIAHQNTRLWMSTEYYVDWEDTTYTPRAAAARPSRTFYASDPQPLTYQLGDYAIEYGQLPEAHTDGDIYVRLAADNVIAVGGVLGVDAFPVLDYATGGWIGGCQEATSLLLELADANTRIVANDGPPQTRAALTAQREMLDELRERIRVRIIAGKGIDEIVADNAEVMAGYETLPEPAQFVHKVYNGLWWGGRLRGAY